jgi:hypothetical protein
MKNIKTIILLSSLLGVSACNLTPEPINITKAIPFPSGFENNEKQLALEKVEKLRKLKQFSDSSAILIPLVDAGYVNAAMYQFNHYEFKNTKNGCKPTGTGNSFVPSKLLAKLGDLGLREYMFSAALCDKKGPGTTYRWTYSDRGFIRGLINQGDPLAKAIAYFGSLYELQNVGGQQTNMIYKYPFLFKAPTIVVSGEIKTYFVFDDQLKPSDIQGYSDLIDMIIAYGKSYQLSKNELNQSFIYNNEMCMGDGLIENKHTCTSEEKYIKRFINKTIQLDSALLAIPQALFLQSALDNKENINVLLGHLKRLLKVYSSEVIEEGISIINARLVELESI